MRILFRVPFEVVFATGMLLVLAGLAYRYHLPILYPRSNGAAFIGIHYLLPLAALITWGLCAGLSGGLDRARALTAPLSCYAVVLWVHFNIKLWTPHINPRTYDALFWSIDQAARPVVDLCFGLRQWLTVIIPFESNLYMYGFILLFYVSFCYHAVRTPAAFRHLFLAALFLQGLGALAYLAFPALGPFLFEDGVNDLARQTQAYMLDVHAHSVRGGAEWLAANGDDAFLAGLGAMPSLHTGGSFLFLWFAARHAKVLLVPYAMMFGFILVAAVACRWHYLIDLPAGIALGIVAIYLASWVAKAEAVPDEMRRDDAIYASREAIPDV